MKIKKLLGIVVLPILVIIAICMFLFSEKDKDKVELVIETKYCDLYYPAEWEDTLLVDEVEGIPHAVTFYACISGMEEQELFELYFGKVNEPVGVIATESGALLDVGISVTPFEPDVRWSKENSEIVYAMQDDINYIISKMPFVDNDRTSAQDEYTETVPEQTESPVYIDMVVQTPYGELCVPGEFAEYIEVEHKLRDNEYLVTFYGVLDESKYLLFDVCFGVPATEGIGTIVNGENEVINVSVKLYELSLNGIVDKEKTENLMRMQDSVGYLLEKMNLSDVEYVPEEIVIPEDDISSEFVDSSGESADIFVETPYGGLYYPGKWKEYVRIEISQESVYSVVFYGSVNGKTEQHLFSLTYAGEEGYELGTTVDSQGNDVVVRMIPGELMMGDDWTDEEKEIIFQMQEDVNYLISECDFA